MNSQTIALIGVVIISPIVTLLTIWIKDQNKLAANGQNHEFEKENKLIEVLQNDIADLKREMGIMKKQLEKKDDEIREIQRRLNTREIDYANLLKEHAELSQNHQNLQIEHDNLKRQYDETVAKLTSLTADHETLKKKTVESAKHMIAAPDPINEQKHE